MDQYETRDIILGYLYDLGINADLNLCKRERLLEELNLSEAELDHAVSFLEDLGALDCTHDTDAAFNTARINSFGITYTETKGIR